MNKEEIMGKFKLFWGMILLITGIEAFFSHLYATDCIVMLDRETHEVVKILPISMPGRFDVINGRIYLGGAVSRHFYFTVYKKGLRVIDTSGTILRKFLDCEWIWNVFAVKKLNKVYACTDGRTFIINDTSLLIQDTVVLITPYSFDSRSNRLFCINNDFFVVWDAFKDKFLHYSSIKTWGYLWMQLILFNNSRNEIYVQLVPENIGVVKSKISHLLTRDDDIFERKKHWHDKGVYYYITDTLKQCGNLICIDKNNNIITYTTKGEAWGSSDLFAITLIEDSLIKKKITSIGFIFGNAYYLPRGVVDTCLDKIWLIEGYGLTIIDSKADTVIERIPVAELTPNGCGFFWDVRLDKNFIYISVCDSCRYLGIEEKSYLPVIKIYPNPVKNKIYLQLDESTQCGYIEIYDITGRLCFKSNLKNVIDVRKLLPGSYLLIVKSKKNLYKQKFIKLK